MSKRRKGKFRAKRNLPIASVDQIPQDDIVALQSEGNEPLERGGVYSEMGADFTYEERHAANDYRARLTHFQTVDESAKVTPYWYVGVTAIVFGFISFFIWPFWMSLATAGLSVISYIQGTKTLAMISAALAIFSFFIAI